MSKKLGILFLMSLGIALAARSFEPVQFYAIVTDDEAQITVEDKSDNVRVGKLTKRGSGTAGMRRFMAITFEDDRAEVEITLKASGKGKFRVNAAGFAPVEGGKPEYSWIDCTALEVNGKTLIPQGRRKIFSFSDWSVLVPEYPISGEQTYVIKATLVKTSAERAAKLDAAARKRAEKAK